MIKYTFLLSALLTLSFVFGQGKAPANWYLKDPVKDKIYGVGSEEAYKLLTGKKSKEVIVAVIDSGVDTEHPDLKEVLWVNEDEIPGNGIDDDKNGYIDDVHGWSFLGGPGGDIGEESSELSRMYYADKVYFANADTNSLSAAEMTRYKKFKEIEAIFLAEKVSAQRQMEGIMALYNYMDNKPLQIIEIGSRNGGFTTILDEHNLSNTAKLYTIDIDGFNPNAKFSDNVTQIKADCFAIESVIGNIISQPGVTLVFCDGGDKIREINTFAKYLKPGDMIFGHDYAKDSETFNNTYRGKIWDWHELWDSAIEHTAIEYNLSPILPNDFDNAVWKSLIKNI